MHAGAAAAGGVNFRQIIGVSSSKVWHNILKNLLASANKRAHQQPALLSDTLPKELGYNIFIYTCPFRIFVLLLGFLALNVAHTPRCCSALSRLKPIKVGMGKFQYIFSMEFVSFYPSLGVKKFNSLALKLISTVRCKLTIFQTHLFRFEDFLKSNIGSFQNTQ